jgi:hypothetical protein
MKLRYFVGVPEDVLRKRLIVYTTIEAADMHAAHTRDVSCNTLYVYNTVHLLDRVMGRNLVLVLDLEDLGLRFDRIYRDRFSPEPPLFKWFEEFAHRLVRLRARASLKEAA